MCGEKVPADIWQYITQGQSARISFTSADKAIGALVYLYNLSDFDFKRVFKPIHHFYEQGFRVVWTEVQDSATPSLLCESTYHYQCAVSGYCISDRLRCDGVKNCKQKLYTFKFTENLCNFMLSDETLQDII